MSTVRKAACLGAVVVVLAGCAGSDRDDLQAWMAEQRAQAKPTITPIVAPKKFTPQAYTQEAGTEPFNIAKLTQALRRDAAQPSTSGLIAPVGGRGVPLLGSGGAYRWAPLVVGLPVLLVGVVWAWREGALRWA